MKDLNARVGWLLAGAALLASGCGEEEGDGATGGAPARPPAVVEIALVEAIPVGTTIEAVGTLDPSERVTIAAEIDGTITEVSFREGDAVAALPGGERPVLFRLDDSILRLEVERAGAARDLAEARAGEARALLGRLERLAAEDAAPAAAVEDARLARTGAEAALREAQAALGLAEERLSRATIRAPLDGRLGERSASSGQYVREGVALVDLVVDDPLEVSFRVPERHAPALALGQPVRVSPDDGTGRELAGEVTFISPAADPSTRTIALRARLANPDRTLVAGGFARVRLQVRAPCPSRVIPEEAVVPRGGGLFVYVVEEGRARRVAVRLGERMPGRVEVVEGVSEGESVVRAGHQRIEDGSLVRVRSSE